MYWSVKKKGVKYGKKAGSKDASGYIKIFVGGYSLLAHRIIWFIHNGLVPEGFELDHKDGNKSNNKIDNLRLSTRGQNQRNIGLNENNKTGFKGVSLNNGRGKPYRASVKFKGVRYHLGLFNTKEEAKAAYDKKAEELHGEFYRK